MGAAHPLIGPNVGGRRLAFLEGRTDARKERLAGRKADAMPRTSPLEECGRRASVPALLAFCGTIDAFCDRLGATVIGPFSPKCTPPRPSAQLSAVRLADDPLHIIVIRPARLVVTSSLRPDRARRIEIVTEARNGLPLARQTTRLGRLAVHPTLSSANAVAACGVRQDRSRLISRPASV